MLLAGKEKMTPFRGICLCVNKSLHEKTVFVQKNCLKYVAESAIIKKEYP